MSDPFYPSLPPYVPVTAWRRPRTTGDGLAPFIIGGALLIVALSGRSRLGQWLRGFFDGLDPSTRRRLQSRVHGQILSPARLRERILGRPKAHIAAEFGPPRTAVFTSHAPVAQPAFWRGDTWYYAIDPRTELAMAVTFENDQARVVEFFQTPRAADNG